MRGKHVLDIFFEFFRLVGQHTHLVVGQPERQTNNTLQFLGQFLRLTLLLAIAQAFEEDVDCIGAFVKLLIKAVRGALNQGLDSTQRMLLLGLDGSRNKLQGGGADIV